VYAVADALRASSARTKLLHVSCVAAQEGPGGLVSCKQDVPLCFTHSLAPCQQVKQGGLATARGTHLRQEGKEKGVKGRAPGYREPICGRRYQCKRLLKSHACTAGYCIVKEGPLIMAQPVTRCWATQEVLHHACISSTALGECANAREQSLDGQLDQPAHNPPAPPSGLA
jgi:hypothetical protein